MCGKSYIKILNSDLTACLMAQQDARLASAHAVELARKLRVRRDLLLERICVLGHVLPARNQSSQQGFPER
jgi:hypothetical protein